MRSIEGKSLLFAAGLMIGVAAGSSVLATDYYVDPVTGSMANAGTSASPWSTLAAVFAAGKTFLPGDNIYLLRGYHGSMTVTGSNTNDVSIIAVPGHTPALRVTLLNADHWYFKGLTILAAVVIDNQNNENSHYDTFDHCYLPAGGFEVYGTHHVLWGNHIRAGGIHLGFHANNVVVSGNIIEDFYSDAIDMKGNSGLFETNLVMNAHKVSGNHNDMFQGWATSGNVLRGNEFRAYSDPNQADLVSPGLSDVQGIGLFDGWYTGWVIENNVLFVDHAIGIWLEGAKNCLVKNNTVVRCGQNAAISTRYPNIRVAAKKPATTGGVGAPSVNNVVLNNAAERFELDDTGNSGSSIGIAQNNVVVSKSAFGSTFLSWATKDLHLKTGATAVIDAGTSSNSPPVIDADGNARPFGTAWDCGAFEYGYVTQVDTTAPSKPTGLSAVIIVGYGVDLHWTASTDNRRVAGYDIFRNGVWLDSPTKPHGGRTRAGTNYLDINADTTGSYTVQAFDHSGNHSPMSDPISGTAPEPDTQAPSIPTNIVATALSSSSILVAWHASTDNWSVAGYRVYRDSTQIASATTTNYTDTGLPASSLHSYKVCAYDAATNTSAFSAIATATTFDPDVTPPAAPSNVAAAAQSVSSILVTWSPATDNVGVADYLLYRNGTNVATVTVTNCLDTGLQPSTTYTYTVKARDTATNLSVFSAAAVATTLDPDVTPPSVPTNVTATAITSGSIMVQWSASTDNRGVAGYVIYCNGVGVDTVASTNSLETGLDDSTLYSYTVTAIDTSGNESAQSSPPATATTFEAPPLLAGDSMEYTVGANLNGLNGGTGWDGPWIVGYDSSLPATIQAGNLGSYPGLDYSGNSVMFWTKGNGNTYENLDRSFADIINDQGQTIWFSLVAGMCNSKNLVTWQLAGLTTDATGTNDANLFETVANAVPTPFKFGSTTLFNGDTNFTAHLVLVKIQMSGDTNAETLTAYSDPDLSASPTTWTGVVRSNLYANGGIVGFSYRGGRASTTTANDHFFMDEIRVATTWQAAVGVSQPDTQPPSVPTNLVATVLSTNAIQLSWSPAADNVEVTAYDVYRGAALLTTVTTTTCTDTGLAPGTAYTYTVKARDAAGNVSAASSPAAATTLSLPPPATVLVEESFNYAATNLAGLNGGTGWAGPWTADSHYDTEGGAYAVADGTMTAYPGLAAVGRYGSFLSGGNGTYYPSAQRSFSTPITDDGGTYWLAFQLQAPTYHKFSSITLLGTTNALIYLKDGVTGMNFQFLGGSYYSPGDANSHLFLVKIQMSGDTNAENASLYYDPDLSTGPASWAALRTGTFDMTSGSITGFRTDSARAGSTGYRLYIDEIRLATTWQAAVGLAGTAPQITDIHLTSPTSLVLQWQSVAGRTYKIQSSSNLLTGFFDTSDTNILATNSITSRTVTVGPARAGFYRVGVLP